MNLDIKMLDNGLPIPTYSRDGDAALDCYSRFTVAIAAHAIRKVQLGFSCAIPVGYVGILAIRSGLSKDGLTLANAIGIIDSNYRGEVCALITNNTENSIKIERGQRVVQLLVLQAPAMKTNVVDELDDTNRGQSGFGSSGQF